ncbi:MAG TPA: Fic family protein [Rhizomicrobium sp.]|jgi:Fic family protein
MTTTYIHQLAAWPGFRWDRDRLFPKLTALRHRQGRLLGRIEGYGIKLRDEAVLQTLTEEVAASSEIEGQSLNRDQVRSSLARRLGIEIGALTPADRNVEGMVQMILDATRNCDRPITKERLFGWHAALFPTGYSGLHKITVGAWRPSEAGPMRVVSGPIGKEHVHYEAPEARLVDREMKAYIAWFNETQTDLDLVLKAAVAHIWFETIHPFDDGNGRIGRALADMLLARSERSAQRFYSISAQIKAEQGKYYDHLEESQKGDLDITDYLDWFLGCLDRAFDGAETILAGVIRKAKFWELHAGRSFNERQQLMIDKLLDGIEGKLTSSKWAKMAKTSQDTAGRDIAGLLRDNVLVKEAGGGRSTSYAIVATPADVLRVIAEYVRTYKNVFAVERPASSSEERAGAIADLAGRIEALAASKEAIRYRDFEPILAGLHASGFYPDNQLIAAFAFVARNAS